MNFINLGFLSFVLSNNSFFRYGSRDDWGGRRKVDDVLAKLYRSSTALTKTSPTFDHVDQIAATSNRLSEWEVGNQFKRAHFSALESLILKSNSNSSHRNFKRFSSPRVEDNISSGHRKISFKPGQDAFVEAFWNSWLILYQVFFRKFKNRNKLTISNECLNICQKIWLKAILCLKNCKLLNNWVGKFLLN